MCKIKNRPIGRFQIRGASRRIRTLSLLIRSQMLYPVKLWMQRIVILYHFIPNASKNNIFIHIKIFILKTITFFNSIIYELTGMLVRGLHKPGSFGAVCIVKSDYGADCTVICPGTRWSGGRWYI